MGRISLRQVKKKNKKSDSLELSSKRQAETLEDANNVICTRMVPARRPLGVDRTAMVGFA